MKRTFYVLPLLFLLLLISGCGSRDKKTVEEISKYIDDNLPTEASEDIEFIYDYNDFDFSIVYSSENEDVLSNEGKVEAVIKDTTVKVNYVITFNNVEYVYSKEITIKANLNAIAIEEISQYIQENIPSETNQDLDFVYQYEDYDFSITYLSADESIISNDGKIGVVYRDELVKVNYVISYKGLEREYSKTIKVIFNQDRADLEKIINYINSATPTRTEENIEFIKSFEDYDFEIKYSSSNPKVLSDDGEVGLLSRFQDVIVTYEIEYKGIKRVCELNIRVYSTPLDDQINYISSWLEAEVNDVIANEEGTLPTVDPYFGYEIGWKTDVPGIIDTNHNVRLAYQPTPVVLIATYNISNIDYYQEYYYTSKGIDQSLKEEYIDEFFTNLMPTETDLRANIIYDGELEIIQSIVSPNTTTQLRPKDPVDPNKGVKMPGGVMWVVIHDTGNASPGADAELHNRYIHNQANMVGGRVASWHYTVDDKIIYQHVPDDEQAWHAGDNELGRLKYGNRNGIGIETCINPENDYELTLRRTAKLTAQLLHKHNLGIDRVVQHYDFSQKNCPQVIRANGWWDDFIQMVDRELFIIKINDGKFNDHKLTWTIDKPHIMPYNGKVNSKPVSDEQVKITLDVEIGTFKKTYEYDMTVKGMTYEEKVLYATRYVLVNTPQATTQNIDLITEIPQYGAIITYESSHPDILSNTGKYTKPEKRTIVTLKAIFKFGNDEHVHEYKIAVS